MWLQGRGAWARAAFVALVMTGCGEASLTQVSPELAVSTERLVFPETWVGTPVEATVTLSNTGGATVLLQALKVSGEGFELPGPVPSRVSAGGRAVVTVRFLAQRTGTFEGELHIAAQDQGLVMDVVAAAKAIPSCDDGNACTDDVFDVAETKCRYQARPGACDDGNACTTADRCQSGQCVGRPVYCDDGLACTDDACDPVAGCVTTLAAACDDGDVCTVDGCGEDGACDHAPAQDGAVCGPTTACTVSVCRDGACLPVALPDGVACGEGDTCTADVCRGGTCVAEDANEGMPCGEADASCTVEVCRSGSCAPEAAADGVGCNDGEICTVLDRCSAGRCVGQAADCDDGSVCTSDSCVSGKGCRNEPVNEGLSCELMGLCPSSSDCRGPAVCVEGTCEQPPIRDQQPCDDGNACTVGEVCSASGVCGRGETVSCDDGDLCTADWCHPRDGCRHDPAPDGTRCDLSRSCLSASVCEGGACVSLASIPDGTRCDDGLFVTSGDRCLGGTCEGEASMGGSALVDWDPTWTGRLGAHVLSGQRLLLRDEDRVTLVDASSRPAVPLMTWRHETPLGEILELDGERAVAVSVSDKGYPVHVRLLALDGGGPLVRASLELPGPESYSAFAAAGPRRVLFLTEAPGAPQLNRLGVVDVTQDALTLAGTVPLESEGELMAVSPSAVYVGDQGVDISDASAPAFMGHFEPLSTGASAYEPSSRRLFTLAGPVLSSWDMSSPFEPRPLTRRVLPSCDGGWGHAVTASARHVAVSCIGTNTPYQSRFGGVFFLNASNLEVESVYPYVIDYMDGGSVEVRFLDVDHVLLRARYARSVGHGASISWRLEVVPALTGQSLLTVMRWYSGYCHDCPPYLTREPGPPVILGVQDGVVAIDDLRYEYPKLFAWQPCPPEMPEVSGPAGGPAGALALHGATLRSGSRPLGREGELQYGLGTADTLAYGSLLYSPWLDAGPLATMEDVSYRWSARGWGCPACGMTLAADLVNLQSGAHFDVSRPFAYDIPRGAVGGGTAAALGPHLVAPWVDHRPENEDVLVIEVFDTAALMAETPTVPTGTLRLSLADCPFGRAKAVWTDPSGNTAAVAVTCGDEAHLFLLDTSSPVQPLLAWGEAEPSASATRALRIARNGLMVRLRGSDEEAVVTVNAMDCRTSLPCRSGRLGEVPTPGATTILGLDGQVVVVGGPAPGPARSGARGRVWIIADFGGPTPVVEGVEVPHPPRWGLQVPDGLLISSEEGVGAMRIAPTR